MNNKLKIHHAYELNDPYIDVVQKIKAHIRHLFGGTRVNIKSIIRYNELKDETYKEEQYIIYNDKLYPLFGNFVTDYTNNYISLYIDQTYYLLLDEDNEQYMFAELPRKGRFGYNSCNYILLYNEPRPIFLLSPTKFEEACKYWDIHPVTLKETYIEFEKCLEYFSKRFLEELRD